ncbi:MAG TPA: thiolase domain-containing protein [Chloroflexi bacterium]|mgnify:CR=1 FL=1|nr:thiolase domain-containing protein [Chloroflexota bacterium]
MQQVAIIGIGSTEVNEHWEYSLRELAGFAALAAMEDAEVSHVDGMFVGNMMSGTANRQQHLGAYLSDWIGMPMIEGVRIESACSSGSAAFRAALISVASGELDTALVIGVEKMTDVTASEISTELSTAADADWESDQGVSFVGLNALLMQRYMHEYGWQKADFANFALNAHANGAGNPKARFQRAITMEQYEKATMIAPPINIMDASPVSDGAAAVVITSTDVANSLRKHPIVSIIGSAASTDSITVHGRKDPLWLTAAYESAKVAYGQAGISPSEIDFFELHDAFSIMSALSLEACGFAERGKGPRLALDGDIYPSGRIPIATRGGLKARGHPVGATGVYQIVEAAEQLRGEAGKNQIENARIGMTQNIGGSGSNVITHIFSNL